VPASNKKIYKDKQILINISFSIMLQEKIQDDKKGEEQAGNSIRCSER
jgi:hypothetical protein